MSFKTKLFLILWLAGMAGVLSFLLVDFSALMASVPVTSGAKIPTITPAFRLLSLAQPAVILSLAVLSGVALASKVGLSSPVAEAIAGGEHLSSAFKPQIIPGIFGGLAGGVAIILTSLVSKSFLPADVIMRMAQFGKFIPIPTRLLYGGITEELMLRWGLMTLLVWAAWRLFQKGQDKPKRAYFVGAILISSVVFGIGHLPIALMLFPEATSAFTLYIVVANSIFGLIAGYLYWKKGLESAMIAHMSAHVVMLTALYFGAHY
jgi:Type II CAAX prenyl endopeptidase Rce1-like